MAFGRERTSEPAQRVFACNANFLLFFAGVLNRAPPRPPGWERGKGKEKERELCLKVHD